MAGEEQGHHPRSYCVLQWDEGCVGADFLPIPQLRPEAGDQVTSLCHLEDPSQPSRPSRAFPAHTG